MSFFAEEQLKEIIEGYHNTHQEYAELLLKIGSFSKGIENSRAQEFLLHGVGRRLRILCRGMEKIFTLFPPNRTEILDDNDRLDVVINLHAYLINVYGIIENLGLSIAHENHLTGDGSDEKLHRNDINLFNKKFQRFLKIGFREYLKTDSIKSWYNRYNKNYRDALVHRIPPYVPPSALNEEQQKRYQELEDQINHQFIKNNISEVKALQDEQSKIGSANHIFTHSFSERSNPMLLHAQLIADFRTVSEIATKALSNFYCEIND